LWTPLLQVSGVLDEAHLRIISFFYSEEDAAVGARQRCTRRDEGNGMHVLVTGGAGFIGSHLADGLIARGAKVRVLDCLDPQVHGESAERPEYLHPDVNLIVGDIRDKAKVAEALRGIDVVFHFAAKVGVGQSMYQIHEYMDVNSAGTGVLLEGLLDHPVKKLLVASSMSIYGEGRYQTSDGKQMEPPERSREQLASGRWEMHDAGNRPLWPIPTPESKRPSLASVYGLSKFDQERLCLIHGIAYNVPAVALRFFNVYGTRQALSNPYTGVLAIFASRLLNGKPPLIFEDGYQRRDFVSVHDIVQGCIKAMESPAASGGVFNLGSGRASTVVEVANAMRRVLEREDVQPQVVGKYRVGDIRHCFADISLARETFGYEPQVRLEDGLRELAAWLRGQVAVDKAEAATEELVARGLTI
jgi:dTDP-L-rhamnose 4-epimerase